MMYKQIMIFVLVFLAGKVTIAQTKPSRDYNLLADQQYTKVNDWIGYMDLYVPKRSVKPVPLIINIHGGGWVHGSKETESGFSIFFDKGYVIANVEYRLAKAAPAPAAIQDCRCALFYLVTNAKRFNIDPDRIVIIGSSAGGHLALMTGLLGNDDRFDGVCNTKRKFRIRAIVDKSGPTDLNRWESIRKPTKASSAWLGGKQGDSVFVNSLSPVSYVTQRSSPTLIIHGDRDNTVPVEQSQTLYDIMKKNKVPVEFVKIGGAGHSIHKEEDKILVKTKLMDFLREKLQ